VRWDDVDLTRLLRDAKRLGSEALSVYVKPDVRLTGFYQDAAAKANGGGTTGTSSPVPTSPSYSR
jgi:hypothetical protein